MSDIVTGLLWRFVFWLWRHNPIPSQCAPCGLTFRSPAARDRHWQKVHFDA